MRRAFIVLAVPVACFLACGAFEDSVDQQPCNEIPEGGCPAPADSDASVVENCKQDPTCSALYACQEGVGWSLLAECPAHDAGKADADAHRDASPPRDVEIDVPDGAIWGLGCPDLDECQGDCPLSLALACPAGQCCDCCNILVCEDGGWNIWGYCDDGGTLVKASAK
jgi:hypothetical protein